jgi:hypothetical protein
MQSLLLLLPLLLLPAATAQMVQHTLGLHQQGWH